MVRSDQLTFQRHTTWGFELAFHLPHLALGRQDCKDARVITNRNVPLRNRYNLSALRLLKGQARSEKEDDSKSHLYLYEAQISCVTTGLCDWYWTCYCFNDEFFDKESRLEVDDEAESQIGFGDPILNRERERAPKEPRPYWLQALANNLGHVVIKYEEIFDIFHSSVTQYVSSMVFSFRFRCSGVDSSQLEKLAELLRCMISVVLTDHDSEPTASRTY